MKHGHSFAVGTLALFLAACGGSSHDSSSTTTPTSGTPQVEALVVGGAADPVYSYQDPTSIEEGDSVQFQLVTFDSAGNRNVLSDVTWRSSDQSATYGAVSASSGLFTATSTRDTGDINLVITGNYNGIDYSTNYRVNARQVRVFGKVLAQGSLAPVQGAQVDIWAPGSAGDATSPITRIATVKTAVNGTFRVSVRATNDSATTATASPLYFTIRTSSIPATGYYDSFVFRNQRYDTGNTACLAPLTNADGSPFTTGDRLLIDSTVGTTSNPIVDSDGNTVTNPSAATTAVYNGTILLTPSSLFPARPTSNGCGG